MYQFYMIADYYRDHPPLHLIAAAFAGVKPSSKQARESEIAAAQAANPLAGLVANFQRAGGQTKGQANGRR